jgi:hypothetical protein
MLKRSNSLISFTLVVFNNADENNDYLYCFVTNFSFTTYCGH